MREETTFVPVPGANAAAYAPEVLAGPVTLKLDANEGACPPDAVLAELARITGEALRRYPPSPARLEAAIARRLGVPAESVAVTAGADDALERAVRVAICPGRGMILPVPTFEMLARYGRRAGGAIAEVPWLDGAYPIDAVLAAATPRTALVAVVSPNNPTGLVATAADLARLSAALPGALLLVDLAYTEFADEDLTGAALALPNALVTRTFSKALGLAGARVGYAVGPRRLVDLVRAAGNPYAVSSMSLALAEARLARGLDDVDALCARVRLERERLRGILARGGARPLASQGNFAFARFADAARVRDELGRRGISVRAFASSPRIRDCLRITVPGNEADFERLAAALAEILPGASSKEVDDVG
jgi:histidinol-phosphate aminotransferase